MNDFLASISLNLFQLFEFISSPGMYNQAQHTGSFV